MAAVPTVLPIPPGGPGMRAVDCDRQPPNAPDRAAAPTPSETPPALKILILEDEPTDAELMQRELRKAGLDFTATRVASRADFIAALESVRPDLVLADCQLPGFSGAEALAHVRHVHPEIPVVIVTGTLGDETAIELLHAGAKDYVLKSNLLRLPSAVARVISLEQGIRARKGAEQAVRDSEAKFRAFTAAAPNAIIVIDGSSTVSYWNPMAERMLGYTAEEAFGRKIHQWLIPARYREAAEAGFRTFAKTGQGPVVGKTVELTALRKDGVEIPVELSLNALRVGTEWHAVGILQDISERKRAEAALIASHRLLETTERMAHIGGFDWDIASGRIVWSRELYRIHGRNPDEDNPTSRLFIDSIHPDDRARVKAAIDASVAENEFVDVDFRIVRPDNEERTVHTHGEIHRDATGTPIRITGATQDITERKRAENTIREDEAKFRSLVEQNVAGIFIIREDGSIGYVNPFFAELLGYAASELIGRPLFDLLSEEEKSTAREKLGAQLFGDAGFVEHTATIKTRDGNTKTFLVNASRSILEGRPASLAVVLDVTESNKAQRELASAMALLTAEHEASPDGIVAVNVRRAIISFNQRFVEMWGFPPEIMASNSEEQIFAWAMQNKIADPAASAARMDDVLSHHERGHHEVTLTDGRIFDIYVATIAMPDGESAGRVWFFRDITERIQATRELAESAAKLSAVLEAAGEEILVADMATRKFVMANRAICEMLGYTAAELIGLSTADIHPPEAGSLAAAHFARIAAGESSLSTESSTRRKDGSLFLAAITASPMMYNGRPHVIGLFTDITERRATESALASQRAILATEHELSPDGILVVDQTGKIVSHNRRFAELFNVPAELLAAKADEPVLQWATEQMADSTAFLARVRYLYDHPAEHSSEEITLKDGRVFERYSAPMAQPDGGSMGRVWFFHDVTERQQANVALYKSKQLIDGILNAMPVRVFWKDKDLVYLGCNAGFARDAGFSAPEDIVGKDDYQMGWYDQAESYRSDDRQVLDSGRSKLLIEESLTDENGKILSILTNKLPLLASNGAVEGVLGTYQDITERKEAQRALQRLNRTLRTLSRGNEVLVHAASEAKLLSEMCHVIVDTGGYRLAWIGVAGQDAEKSITPVAWAGAGEFLKTSRITWADEPFGRGPHGRAIRSGQPQVSENVGTDPSMAPWQEAAIESGFAAVAAFPLKDASGVFAVLMIDAAEIGAFDAEELKLLRELAEDLSFGIRGLREHTAHEALNRRWQTSLEATVGAIANTVEMRDPYTAGHQQRVARLAVAMARELGLSEHQTQGLYLAGIIHDVGKINIPAEILNKPGKLSNIELQLIHTHAQSGYDIIKGVDFPWPIAEMVRQHHERLDGSGYPQGMKGEAILPEAKILAVADVVEAMMSHRPYRAALGIEAALAEIEKGRGRVYEPAAVDACIALFRQKGFSFE